MNTWLLLIYKVPNEPSARRVYVWRKLKALGAILLHDSAWVLPATSRTREKLQWLATEINEMEGGAALLWEAQQVFTGKDSQLVQQFTEQVDSVYRDILAALVQPDADLTALAKRYQQAALQDYFHSAVGEQVRQALIDARERKEL
jgi:hypothetical protein